jgi:WD repeat-containing protein 19
VELSFLESYGPLQRHLWFGDGFMLLGFRTGQVAVVSSRPQEMGQEVYR